MARLFPLTGRKDQKTPLASMDERQLGLAGESLFSRMLCLERRRSERTGHSFMLMLLGIEALGSDVDARVIEKIEVALASVTRDTDIRGWYKCYSTIGVIFTTVNGAGPGTARSAILDKVSRALRDPLGAGQVQKIHISFHFFPEEESGKRVSPSSDAKLYPDLNHNSRTPDLLFKRLIDIAGGLCALLLLSPVFLAVSALIKLTSRGPVLFRQRRLGKFGKEFTFVKFRSMYVDNDPEVHRTYVQELIRPKNREERGVYKLKDDRRITPLGRFLRKSSFDELPQFLNVLKGDMSLVGPRPPIPYEFESYSLWHRRRIIEARPGITGAWQV